MRMVSLPCSPQSALQTFLRRAGLFSHAVARLSTQTCFMKSIFTPFFTSFAAFAMTCAASAQDLRSLAPSVPAGDTTTVTIGIGGGIAPRYFGSDSYRHVVAPDFAVASAAGYFASLWDGVGYRFSSASGVSGSVALGYDFGRTEHNRAGLPGSDHLRGMGNIDGSARTRLTLGYALTPRLSLSGTVDVPLAHGRGMFGRASAQYLLLAAAQDDVAIQAGLIIGSGQYNRTYFGVSDAQSSRSGFAPYSLDGGPFATEAAIAWQHRFDRHWMVMNTLSVSSLVGKAARSPIVERRMSVMALSGVRYTF
ncbi:MipA/OmpV family protein [Cupriavidus pauculus]|uniref:MipA/OmpV family protein n=2 Tax=Cupriavidus pauculus TaxID=82633 RepID=A0A2N5C5R1_9BURK|nr:MipA/OmpV family protein [Cupriavidus pauculus]